MRRLAVMLVAAGLLTGCGPSPANTPAPAASSGAPLAVTLPDLSRAEPVVQSQARELHTALTTALARGEKGESLAAAYGRLGMLLQAAEYLDAAEPCYRNAESEAPAEPDWPYYLGRLYQSTGRADDAAAAFTRVLKLAPADVPALLRLGRLALDRGDHAGAARLFEQARAAAPGSVAALAGLGQAALAERDFAKAAAHLEEGLAVAPNVLSLHSPLANAYRALGRTKEADEHQRLWRNVEIPVDDPRQLALDAVLDSGLSFELRGVRALNQRDWTGAVSLFRSGLASAPPRSAVSRSLQHKLGTALWMSGDERGAVQQFEAVLRTEPAGQPDESSAKAHFSLGVVRASRGQLGPAITHLTAAVQVKPGYLEAQLALADVTRSAGRAAEALTHYDAAARLDPRANAATIGAAAALVRLGREAEARDRLARASEARPDQAPLQQALARVLAASSDARVRDGQRALAIVEQLAATDKTVGVGETLAMALAEVGRFDEAVMVQQSVREALMQSGDLAGVDRVTQNLALYTRKQPCRRPWRDDEMIAG